MPYAIEIQLMKMALVYELGKDPASKPIKSRIGFDFNSYWINRIQVKDCVRFL